MPNPQSRVNILFTVPNCPVVVTASNLDCGAVREPDLPATELDDRQELDSVDVVPARGGEEVGLNPSMPPTTVTEVLPEDGAPNPISDRGLACPKLINVVDVMTARPTEASTRRPDKTPSEILETIEREDNQRVFCTEEGPRRLLGDESRSQLVKSVTETLPLKGRLVRKADERTVRE